MKLFTVLVLCLGAASATVLALAFQIRFNTARRKENRLAFGDAVRKAEKLKGLMLGASAALSALKNNPQAVWSLLVRDFSDIEVEKTNDIVGAIRKMVESNSDPEFAAIAVTNVNRHLDHSLDTIMIIEAANREFNHAKWECIRRARKVAQLAHGLRHEVSNPAVKAIIRERFHEACATVRQVISADNSGDWTKLNARRTLSRLLIAEKTLREIEPTLITPIVSRSFRRTSDNRMSSISNRVPELIGTTG